MATNDSSTKGCTCDTCGETLSEVVETRNYKGYVRRRRQCFNGHSFTTYEYTVAKNLRPHSARVRVNDLMAFLFGQVAKRGRDA